MQNKQNKKIRTGDTIIVIAGNDRGLTGEVVSRSADRVVVRGANVRKKHVKKSEKNPSGGIVDMERPFHISNVALCVDEAAPRKVKVGYDKEGQKILVYRNEDSDVLFRPVKKAKE